MISIPRTHARKKSAEPGQRSAGTDTDDNGIEMVPHLFPDFRTSCALVRERIRRIAELVDVKSARNFFGQAERHVLIIFRMTARNIGTREPHFRAERTHMRDFFLRHFVGDDKDDAIAFRARDQARGRDRYCPR